MFGPSKNKAHVLITIKRLNPDLTHVDRAIKTSNHRLEISGMNLQVVHHLSTQLMSIDLFIAFQQKKPLQICFDRE